MSAIIPLSGAAKLPAYLANRAAQRTGINADVAMGGGYPTLSIKGKVFTLVKDGERKVLTRPDDPDEVLQNLTLAVVRANTKSRVYYAKEFEEGSEGEAAKPDCHSSDSIAPMPDSRNPQAKKCQLCPHAVWGTGKQGKGTACAVNTRLAVVDPEQAAKADELEPYLLRVPAGSRSNFADVVKAADARGIDYNMLAMKVGFDKEAPAPKLTFKLVGLLDEAVYEKVNALYGDDTVLDMMGLKPVAARQESAPEAEQPKNDVEQELDAILAAKAATDAAKASAKASAAQDDDDDTPPPVKATAKEVAEAVKPARKTATKKTVVEDADDADAAPAPVKAAAKPAPDADAVGSLLGDLDDLLGSLDD